MRDFKQKVAVVTGGASGIGQALALELARRGADVAYCDVADLGQTDKLMAALPGRHLSARVDISDRAAVAAFREQVLAQYDHVDVLINNAGIALGDRTFPELTQQDLEKITGVNYWGVVHTTQLFYPDLLERPQSALVNLSSAQGILALPYLVPYCTTKFAVRGFTEALRVEHTVRGLEHMSIHCVHPGAVATDITRNADYQGENSQRFHEELQQGVKPERAAQLILRGVSKGKGRIFIGNGIWNDRLARWFPNTYPGLIKRIMRLTGVAIR
ncbi:SDR family oxidoreductase [Pseudohalioglobus sediminis]|uniref:SDR family oxidoreductase n=1 Tax=Pseudohalioglobus sediminis TaxID=2606449 RepID=A0A5B0X4F6_9GAMM|nr:SDR family oxidoreductase [Pseudohalioglobus sediminis]KAA1194132.1 SDR family oxidoreductase [Pseudohalioglobus sediminis]